MSSADHETSFVPVYIVHVHDSPSPKISVGSDARPPGDDAAQSAGPVPPKPVAVASCVVLSSGGPLVTWPAGADERIGERLVSGNELVLAEHAWLMEKEETAVGAVAFKTVIFRQIGSRASMHVHTIFTGPKAVSGTVRYWNG